MKRKRKWKIKLFAALFAVVGLIFVFYNTCVVPVILAECRAKTKIKVREVVFACAYDVVSSYENAENLGNLLNTDEKTAVVADTVKINKIAQKICSNSQKMLISADNSNISINLGTMSGIVFLGGKGPEIKIDTTPVNTVCYTYDVLTESAGINRIHYKISLNIKTEVNLLIPGKPERECVESEVLLVDCILSGDVPDIILGLKTYDLNV